MRIAPGTTLGPYEILSAIGAGGMGEVYRARDTRLNRIVAIKVLPEAFASDADRLRRFHTEAEALGALNHPGLLAIFDVGTAGDIRFIVSEYLEGRTLRDVIAAGGLPPRRVADYGRQLASALAAAHERGIVHRDLKPENIFVTHDDRVKILDFGLAKDVTPRSSDATTSAEGTAQGMVLGTAGYMSPEQVNGGAVDARSDLFSTGAVLYEMLSGRRAFAGSSVVETLNAILKEDPADLDERVARALPGLPAIVSRCLAKTPRQRFQSASDLSFAIETLAAPAGSSKALPAAAPSRALRAWRIAAIVAGALLIVTVAAFLWRGRARPPVLSYTRLTLQTVTVFNARFAPDGETVVYSAAKEGHHPDLYVQRRQAAEAQRLNVGTAHVLSISSKGEIALLTHPQFIRHRWFRGTLARMPLEGTAPREVLADVTEADWLPDGSELAIVHLVGGEQRIEFPIGRVRYTTTGHITDLRLSPRGDRMAFMEHPAGVDDRGHVTALDLEGHKTVLTPEFPGEDGVAWAPDGSEIYFSGASDEPIPRLTVQAVTLAGARRMLAESADYLWLYDVSPRGDLLVVEGEEHYHVMAHAPDRPDEGDISWLDQSGSASITGDGSHVLFSEFTIGPNYAVGFRSTGGSPVVRIGDGTAFDVSKDGAWALASVPTSPQQLTLYPTGAGQPRPLDRGGITDFQSARLFRDKQRVLACGREPDKPGRCYVQTIGGAPAAVTPPNTSEGTPSPDGHTIVARGADGTFAIYPLDGAPRRAVKGLSADDTVVDWSPDGRSLVVLGSREIPAPVDRLDLATGARSRLANLAPPDRTAVVFVMNASVSDDGKSYAYSLITFPARLAIVHGVR